MHIVLADDHDLVRDALRVHAQALADNVTVSEAATCAQVLALAGQNPRPDLVLLDLNMPGMDLADAGRPDGMGGLRAIAAAFPAVPVVVVSGYSDSTTVAAAMRSGAKGFIPKTTAAKALRQAIRQVLAGGTYVPDPTGAEAAPAWPITESPLSIRSADHPLRRVSAREATVLQLLIRGLTNKEIALQLGLKEITVKVHLQHAYRKIGASNRADAVRIILQSGYREDPAPPLPATA